MTCTKCVAVEFSKIVIINDDSIITCTCIKHISATIANTLKLNLNDLLDISSETNTLRVIGDSGDKVEATGFNKSTAGDVANGITLGNVTYDVYKMIVSSPAPALKTSAPPLPVKISSPKPATNNYSLVLMVVVIRIL
jgi:hypothetical protein